MIAHRTMKSRRSFAWAAVTLTLITCAPCIVLADSVVEFVSGEELTAQRLTSAFSALESRIASADELSSALTTRLADVEARLTALEKTTVEADSAELRGISGAPAGARLAIKAGTHTGVPNEQGQHWIPFQPGFANGLLSVTLVNGASGDSMHVYDQNLGKDGFYAVSPPGIHVRVNWIAIGW